MQPTQTVRAGNAAYYRSDGSRNRWGDYSGIDHDPVTDCLWMYNEYAKSVNFWGTVWGEFCLDFSCGNDTLEPGESLEQAVRREIKEEAGVDVGDAQYHSSQPWPFPSSLMIGFTGAALNDGINIGDEELQDARWFRRADVDAALENGEIRLPPRISIARQLIEGWRRAG